MWQYDVAFSNRTSTLLVHRLFAYYTQSLHPPIMHIAYASPPRLTQTEYHHTLLSAPVPNPFQPLYRDAPPQQRLSQQPRFTHRRKAIPGYHSGSSHHYYEIDSPSCRFLKQVVGYEKLEESEKEAERRWKKQAGRLKGQSSLCLLHAECLSILPIKSPYGMSPSSIMQLGKRLTTGADNIPSHVSACEAILYSVRTRKPCNSPNEDEYEKASSTCKSSNSALTPPSTSSPLPFQSIERSQGNISYVGNAYDPSGSPFSPVPAPPQNDHWLLDLTQSIEQPGRWDVRPENAGSMPSGLDLLL